MAESLVFLNSQFGQECLEQLYTVCYTVLLKCLLYACKIDGALEHLAAVTVLSCHIPDIVDLFCGTLR